MEKKSVSQTCKRHFTIASKKSISLELADFQTSPHAEKPRPISWAIQDLVDKVYAEDDIFNNASKANEVNQARMQYLHEHNIHDLPSSERPKMSSKIFRTWPYRKHLPAMYRMYWDKPSPSITTGYSSMGEGGLSIPKNRDVSRPTKRPEFKHSQTISNSIAKAA